MTQSWQFTLEKSIKAIVSIKANHVRSFDTEIAGWSIELFQHYHFTLKKKTIYNINLLMSFDYWVLNQVLKENFEKNFQMRMGYWLFILFYPKDQLIVNLYLVILLFMRTKI